MQKMWANKNSGFSLLELCTVIAIIGMLAIVAIPEFQEWGAKRSFNKAINEFYTELSNARMQSFTQNTVVKMATSASGDTYTIVTSQNSNASATCGSTLGWTATKTTTVSINSNFQITGSGIGNLCFFRDGTSSGGTYVISQKNGQTNLGSGNINIYLATGFIDVTKN